MAAVFVAVVVLMSGETSPTLMIAASSSFVTLTAAGNVINDYYTRT